MKKTENYNLGKPELHEFYDVNVQNNNMDIIDEELNKLAEHTESEENPHKVTTKQIGLDKVNNTSDEDKPVSKAQQEALDTKANVSDLTDHTGNTNNPHNVTKAQLGLGSVENKSSATIRGELTSTNVTKALGYTPINQSLKGASNGLAELDANGKVPSNQLPAFVDDVLEYSSKSNFPATGETGKIYVDTSTNLSYRWGGSAYVEISPSLALGETSSTAYRGDKGKVAYEHSQKTSGNPHNVTKSDVGLSNVPNVATNDQTPTYTVASSLAEMTSGEKLSVAFGKIAKAVSSLISHLANKSNPHGVTASQISALTTTGDTKSNTVTFTSSDVADGSATSWTSVTKLSSGITHATFFARVSQMFKNVRYLYKVLGTTDISAIGGGTVTGAISTLNSNLVKETHLLNNSSTNSWITVGDVSAYRIIEVIVFDGTPQQRGQCVVGISAASHGTSAGKPVFIYRGDTNEVIAQFYVLDNILYLFTYVGYTTSVYVL